MAKKVINYEDDIFYLNILLKNLKDGLKLEVDPEFFANKFNQDILFISKTVSHIYTSLLKNEYMLKRLEYLKNLQRLMTIFQSLLEDITGGRLPFASEMDEYKEGFNALARGLGDNLKTVRSILTDINLDAAVEESVVSEEEFKFLLSGDEEQG